ncbi:hypothetical protein HDE_02359 [Halotydeus destructor]|nr:hypothetical protein HDE_02359 [Halotydeus destructor]
MSENEDVGIEAEEDFDVEAQRKSWEIEDHWELRRDFLKAHKDKFPKNRLLCLAQMFVNVEILGTSYAASLMEEVSELSTDVECLEEFRRKKKELAGDSKFKPAPKVQSHRGGGNSWNNRQGGGQGYNSKYQQSQKQGNYQKWSNYGEDQSSSRQSNYQAAYGQGAQRYNRGNGYNQGAQSYNQGGQSYNQGGYGQSQNEHRQDRRQQPYQRSAYGVGPQGGQQNVNTQYGSS